VDYADFVIIECLELAFCRQTPHQVKSGGLYRWKHLN